MTSSCSIECLLKLSFVRTSTATLHQEGCFNWQLSVNTPSHQKEHIHELLLSNSPISQRFSPSGWAARISYISSKVITNNYWLHSIISQVLLLYKTWGYHNKFDSTESLWVYYWYVKIPQCRYMENGIKYNRFYVQKYIAHLCMCYDPPLVHDKPPGALIFVKLVYSKPHS